MIMKRGFAKRPLFGGCVTVTILKLRNLRGYEKQTANAKEEDKDAVRKQLKEGIDLLYKAYKVSKTAAADSLAYLIDRLANFVNDPEHPDEAINLSREAYKIARNNTKVKQSLATKLASRGISKENKGRDGSNDLEEAYKISPDTQYVRENYAILLCGRAIQKWNSSYGNIYSLEAALSMMAKSIRVFPTKHALEQGWSMYNQAQGNYSLYASSEAASLASAIASLVNKR